jgi:murein DD-endopeptidase MepM/ murein hydrolase activator NlpD
LQQQHADALEGLSQAQEAVELTADQLDSIKRITSEVHDQVLKLQNELHRIDVRLKSKAERVLIEKGLLDPKAVAEGRESDLRPHFVWPVIGPVSAGFLNAAYKLHFGVPHLGMDIVVPQSTPVVSAADGIVFVVRDGGERGYTYILIGHRSGFATLYGHLSVETVVAGQEVSAGQIIGLSGGRPGSHGAGPMTTASHLHFEMISNGVHVDPKGVLP